MVAIVYLLLIELVFFIFVLFSFLSSHSQEPLLKFLRYTHVHRACVWKARLCNFIYQYTTHIHTPASMSAINLLVVGDETGSASVICPPPSPSSCGWALVFCTTYHLLLRNLIHMQLQFLYLSPTISIRRSCAISGLCSVRCLFFTFSHLASSSQILKSSGCLIHPSLCDQSQSKKHKTRKAVPSQ